jgi:RNA polymerase sigma factor (sigma-70 family)
MGSLVDVLSGREDEPVSGLELGERSEWVRQAVAALPEQLRSAVRLVYFRGMKYREAADELNVPVGTVKSRLHSAVNVFRRATSVVSCVARRDTVPTSFFDTQGGWPCANC